MSLSWGVVAGNTICACLSLLCLPQTRFYISPRLQISPYVLAVLTASEGPSQCVETFPLSQLPPKKADSVPIPYSFFFFYLFSNPVMWRFSFPFGNPNFCQCSADVLWELSTCRYIFYVLVANFFSTSYSYAILPEPLSSLYILGTNPLSNAWFTNIFFHPIYSLSVLLMKEIFIVLCTPISLFLHFFPLPEKTCLERYCKEYTAGFS